VSDLKSRLVNTLWRLKAPLGGNNNAPFIAEFEIRFPNSSSNRRQREGPAQPALIARESAGADTLPFSRAAAAAFSQLF
jgi:hypothetical protein